MSNYAEEDEQLVEEPVTEQTDLTEELPPEPGSEGDHNSDQPGVDGDPETLPEGDVDNDEDTEL